MHRKSWAEIKRSIKFAIFSVSAGIIEFASFALLDGFTKWDYWLKYLIALILSVLWNFTLNRRFTFRSAGNVPIAMLKVACFYLVFTPVTTVLGNYLVEALGWNDLLVTILNMACNLVTASFGKISYMRSGSKSIHVKLRDDGEEAALFVRSLGKRRELPQSIVEAVKAWGSGDSISYSYVYQMNIVCLTLTKK